MGKIVNGVANDFEFDMFPPNVEKIIITKENYNRLFKGLEEENMFLRDKIDKAIEHIETDLYPNGSYCVNGSDLPYDTIETLLNILKGE